MRPSAVVRPRRRRTTARGSRHRAHSVRCPGRARADERGSRRCNAYDDDRNEDPVAGGPDRPESRNGVHTRVPFVCREERLVRCAHSSKARPIHLVRLEISLSWSGPRQVSKLRSSAVASRAQTPETTPLTQVSPVGFPPTHASVGFASPSAFRGNGRHAPSYS